MATDEHGGETDGASDGQRSDHTKRRYMVGRVALRTKFFDTRLLEAVSSGPPAAVRHVQVNWICIITLVLKHPWAKICCAWTRAMSDWYICKSPELMMPMSMCWALPIGMMRTSKGK